ncbi:hypothetical protein N7522_011269 [Penicillium canescens]|uniref:FAD-binding PCMH-type domain-containing protein n=1 Tax=Penicillium canescens TaxID=5083 RepID=A0AAD6IKC9_PENCN|nr:uncharacterized protein N7446_006866 [Penicillium canescens]KAJ5991062.1 hypothetical protein N7522_011269 [Penicillium canescens]KAJ6049806.1 hypothetical protein N7444_006522 [Penicillium canescens]KAJ6052224.1 hypothetical protein N7460_002758 [Penicillium canescens]KAJ6062746.1 hypothetical protein N7446_006866 [Penicillium canescens]
MRHWLLSLGALLASGGSTNAAFCRCQPSQPCWPSEANWAALNSSVEGNLVAVKPFGYPCHDPNFNDAECTIVKENTYSSSYRSSQPGALQWENWESWPEEEEQCYVETDQSTPCKQGRISLFSVIAQTAEHIQAAVKFAAHHNIKLVIRNTGHDFLGRSSAPHSLQIFTHGFKNISVADEFVPKTPAGTAMSEKIKAVTLGAGVQLREMYAYLGSKGLMVVGGASNTVGVAGGYIQGGGHSFLGWMHGMASDNALEFQVVLADGSLVFANAYQNIDLFFALRGGGGGSFGVVVSVTVKAYPDYPVVYTMTNYSTKAGEPFWNGVDAFHKHIVRLNDNGGSGWYAIIPDSSSATPGVSTFLTMQAFVNQTNTKSIEELMSPVVSDLKNATGVAPLHGIVAFPSMSSMYLAMFSGNDTTGLQTRLASRLVSRSFFESGNSTQLTKGLAGLSFGPEEAVVGVVTGGQVSRNRDIKSGLNPAWRDTLVHVIIVRFMSAEMTFEEQEAVASNITQHDVPMLRSLEPGKMGAYGNEADADEVDFQESFWGENYPRLRGIKKLRDPRDLFIVRKGVGSESWDDSGLCRVS